MVNTSSMWNASIHSNAMVRQVISTHRQAIGVLLQQMYTVDNVTDHCHKLPAHKKVVTREFGTRVTPTSITTVNEDLGRPLFYNIITSCRRYCFMPAQGHIQMRRSWNGWYISIVVSSKRIPRVIALFIVQLPMEIWKERRSCFCKPQGATLWTLRRRCTLPWDATTRSWSRSCIMLVLTRTWRTAMGCIRTN